MLTEEVEMRLERCRSNRSPPLFYGANCVDIDARYYPHSFYDDIANTLRAGDDLNYPVLGIEALFLLPPS